MSPLFDNYESEGELNEREELKENYNENKNKENEDIKQYKKENEEELKEKNNKMKSSLNDKKRKENDFETPDHKKKKESHKEINIFNNNEIKENYEEDNNSPTEYGLSPLFGNYESDGELNEEINKNEELKENPILENEKNHVFFKEYKEWKNLELGGEKIKKEDIERCENNRWFNDNQIDIALYNYYINFEEKLKTKSYIYKTLLYHLLKKESNEERVYSR